MITNAHLFNLRNRLLRAVTEIARIFRYLGVPLIHNCGKLNSLLKVRRLNRSLLNAPQLTAVYLFSYPN